MSLWRCSSLSGVNHHLYKAPSVMLEIKFMLYCVIANSHTKAPNKSQA